MKRRQSSIPHQWLIADERSGEQLSAALRRLPRGAGVLLLHRDMPQRERTRLLSRLRRIARRRSLTLADEVSGEAARVHNLAELRRAGLDRIPLIFLSPMFPTRSHPGWRPIRLMRAAALVRLSKVPVMALGGMDERRFRRVEHLGFQGWAGIDAWIRI
jgi:thiamine-phosphate pyrophosphorylase